MRNKSYKILKAYFAFMFIVILFSGGIINAQTATAPSGSGTSGDPYLIATLDNLYWVTQNSSSWGSYFKQTADIDASSTNTWDGNKGFTPIGNISTKFTGTYDGNGKTLTGLFINRSSVIQVGLFGRASTSAEIINVGLINVNITAGNSVGGLVGFNEGDITNSYSTGSVSCTDYNVGGLVGYNWSSTSITNSYSTCSVIGKGQVGGLVGHNRGIISNSYSTGSVSKSGSSGLVGGLVGAITDGTSTNSFWDTQTSGQSSSWGGTGKTTAEMKTLSTFLNAGWDFEVETVNGTNNYWDMDNVNQSINNGYPFLSWQNGVSTSVVLGDNIAEAYDLGDFQVGASPKSKTVSNNNTSYTSQHSTSPGKDVFYKFNIIDDATDPGKIGLLVNTSLAAFNSVIYLLDASGNQLAVNNGSGNNSRITDFTGTLSAGTYYVVVDGSSAAQTGLFYLTVQVVQRVIDAKFSASPETGCSTPHTVFFTDQSISPDVWSWNFGDGASSTAQNPIHTYNSSGTFPVTLTIQDTIYEVTDTFTDTIFVSNPNADFSGTPLFGCGPLTANFTDASVEAVGWEWTFGDGDTSTAQNPAHTYSTPGTYTVTLKVTSSLGCTNTKTRTNYVQVIGPNVDFGIVSTSGSVPLTVSFKDLSTSGSPITGWSWDFGDGATSTAQNPTHIYNTAGMYDVSLTVQDLDGCPRTLTKNNFVNTPPTVTINQASGQTDPSNSSTINFTVVFNEAVIGFTTGDVTISGTAGATTAVATEIAPNDGTTYNVAVTGMANDGTVIISIAAGVATDNGGAANIASTSTDNSVTYDTTPPTITINTIAGDDIINGTEDDSNVTISGTTSGAEDGRSVTVGLNGKTYNGAVSSNAWSVTVPAADVQALAASETVTSDVSDLAGNTATQATKDITRDTDVPTVVIGSPNLVVANSGPVSYSVSYSGATSINLTSVAVVLNTTGTASGSVSVINGTTSNPTVTVSNISGVGSIGISITAGTSSDGAGNLDLGAGPSATFLLNTAPAVSSVSGQTINEDDTLSLKLDVKDIDGNGLSYTSQSSNGAVKTYVIDGTLYAVPSENWNGETNISVDVNDGNTSTTVTFKLTVAAVNDAPVIPLIENVYRDEDDTAHVPLTVSDAEGDKLSFTIISSNENVSVEKEEGYLILTPKAEWSGTAHITINVSDGELTSQRTFPFIVSSVNDAPAVSFQLSPFTFNEDEGITFTNSELYPFISDPDNADSTLSITFSYGGDNLIIETISDSSVSIKGKLNWFGLDTVTVNVSDGEITTSAPFAINVISVNDIPLFTNTPEKVTISGSEGITLNVFDYVTDIETPDTLLTFELIPGNDSLFYNLNQESGELRLTASAGYKGETTLQIKATDANGGSIESIITVGVESSVTGMEDLTGIPTEYEVSQNYPNPFNPSTKIRYGLPNESKVHLVIYNILGQEVAVLKNTTQSAGYHEVEWNASRLSSGMYIYRLTAESTSGQNKYTQVKKMLMIK